MSRYDHYGEEPSKPLQVVELTTGDWAVKNGEIVIKSSMTNAEAWKYADRARRFRSWETERKEQI